MSDYYHDSNIFVNTHRADHTAAFNCAHLSGTHLTGMLKSDPIYQECIQLAWHHCSLDIEHLIRYLTLDSTWTVLQPLYIYIYIYIYPLMPVETLARSHHTGCFMTSTAIKSCNRIEDKRIRGWHRWRYRESETPRRITSRGGKQTG